MTHRICVFLIWVLLPGVVLAQGVPIIRETPPPPEPAKPQGEPISTQQIVDTQLPFHGKLARGHDLYKTGNYEGALSAYEQAKSDQPNDPIAYYFIGCALAKLGRFDNAIIALKTMATMAGTRERALHAKALFMVAVVEELQGKRENAKEAWQAYKSYAVTAGDITTFPATAESRLQAFEKVEKLDQEYKIVRERIANSQ